MPNMINLSSYIFSAMVAWVPIKNHIYENSDETEERYHLISETITDTVNKFDTNHIFPDNENGKVKTALLMASIASYESHFHRAVYRCKKGSPGKISWGIFQVQGPKFEVCGNKEAGAAIALKIIDDSFSKCKRYNLSDKLSYYTDGSCHHNWSRSKIRVNRAMVYFNNHRPEKEESI